MFFLSAFFSQRFEGFEVVDDELFFLAMNNALCLQRIDIAGDVGAMDIGEGGKIGERWKFTDEIAAVLLKCAIFMDERNKEGIDLAFCAEAVGGQHLLQENAVARCDKRRIFSDKGCVGLQKSENIGERNTIERCFFERDEIFAVLLADGVESERILDEDIEQALVALIIKHIGLDFSGGEIEQLVWIVGERYLAAFFDGEGAAVIGQDEVLELRKKSLSRLDSTGRKSFSDIDRSPLLIA